MLAKEGILRAYLLVAKGEAIAYRLGTIQSGTYYAWATSYLPIYSKLSPGTVLLHRVMDLLVKEGVLLFDFGTGESDIKQIMGSHQINEVDLRLYARRIQPTITYALDFSFMRLNQWLNKLFRRINVQNILRRKWRKKLVIVSKKSKS